MTKKLAVVLTATLVAGMAFLWLGSVLAFRLDLADLRHWQALGQAYNGNGIPFLLIL